MKGDYSDIVSRISEQPSWYDSHGTPRYGVFIPDLCPNIYADEIMLAEICCQSCGVVFEVEANWDSQYTHQLMRTKLSQRIEDKGWRYGDPPVHDCTGDVMTSIPLQVLRFYRSTAHRKYRLVLKYTHMNIRPDWSITEEDRG